MTLYKSNPGPISTAAALEDGPYTLGVEFAVTQPNCYFKGFRWYQSKGVWTGTPQASLYAVGSTSQLVAPVSMPSSLGIMPYTASSEPQGVQYDAAKAFDNDPATIWLGTKPTPGSPTWIRRTLVTLPPTVVTEYRITPHTTPSYSPSTWIWQGWNGSAWVDLDTRTGITWPTTAQQSFTYANTVAYSQYRLLISDNAGGATYVGLVALELVGVAAETNGVWIEKTLDTPYLLTPYIKYRAGILFPTTRPKDNGSLTQWLINGPLAVPNNAESVNGNHTYAAGASLQNPTNAANYNYMVDVIIDQAAAASSPSIGFWGILQAIEAAAAATTIDEVTIVSVDKTPTTNTSGSRTITLTTTPQPGDVIALLYVGQNSGTPTDVTGCGATWDLANKKGASSAAATHWLITGENATSAGVITMTIDTTLGRAAYLCAYLIRGLGTVANRGFLSTSAYSLSLDGPGQPVAANSVVVDAVLAKGGMTWPVQTVAQPAANVWTAQGEDAGSKSGHAISRISSIHKTQVSIPSPSTSLQISQFVIVGKSKAYRDAVMADSPMVWFGMEDLSGATTFADSSGNARPATIVGTPGFAKDPAASKLRGSAIALTPTQYGYITAPSWIANVVELSAEAFFKTTATTRQTIIAVDNVAGTPGDSTRKFGLNLNPSGNVYFMSYTLSSTAPSAQSPLAYNDGRWHHVVATRTATTLYLYIDKVLVATQAIGGTLYGLATTDLTVGVSRGNAGATYYPFDGQLDEVSLYAATLSQARVTAHYDAGMTA